MTSATDQPPVLPNPMRDFLANLQAGLGLVFFQRTAHLQLHASVGHFIALAVFDILLGALLDRLRIGPQGQWLISALPNAIYALPWILLCAWASCRAAGEHVPLMRPALALLSIGLWISLISQLAWLVSPDTWQAMGAWARLFWWLPTLWWLFACIAALVRSCEMLPEQRMGAVLAALYLLCLPGFALPGRAQLWVAQPEQPEGADERWRKVTREEVLYNTSALLDAALERIQPGQAGQPELFLISLAGHGAQDVFLREVQAVDALFAERFGTRGHSIVLANNPATVDTLPLASVTALRRTLDTLRQRMNHDEDVLFLFMTSHGSPGHEFDISLWPYEFDALTPARLRELLDTSGIRNRVIVVSACYAGGFISPLETPHSLIITAARADRASHGCTHEADWTFFGRAYFNEALSHTSSFEEAFKLAVPNIAKREKTDGYEASAPQMSVGNQITPVLNALAAPEK